MLENSIKRASNEVSSLISFFNQSNENLKNSNKLLSRKRKENPFFIIKIKQKSKLTPEGFNNNEENKNCDRHYFTSTTNLSKESSSKDLKKRSKEENERKKNICEKNLTSLYAIHNYNSEKYTNLNLQFSSFQPKEFLKRIKTKNNFITMNKKFSGEEKLDKNNLFNDLVSKNTHNFNEYALISELNDKSPNCHSFLNDQKNLSAENLQEKFNDPYLTANGLSKEFLSNLSFFSINLFDKSEFYSERAERIHNFLYLKSKILTEEKRFYSSPKNEEKSKFDENSEKSSIFKEKKSNFKIQENNAEKSVELEENIINYECVFSDCSEFFKNQKEWDHHYSFHLTFK